MTCLLSGTETQFKKAVRMQNLKLLWDTLELSEVVNGSSLTSFISPQRVLVKNKMYSGKCLKISTFHIKIWISGNFLKKLKIRHPYSHKTTVSSPPYALNVLHDACLSH